MAMTSSADGAPHTKQARLVGPSSVLDRRVNAARADLADAALAGVVAASRYADGTVMCCGAAVAMLHAGPDAATTAVSALLPGERFTVFDQSGGWACGQCAHDRYVGWLCADALLAPSDPPTHRIGAATAAVFAAPDIKSRVVATLPLNAVVAVSGVAGNFVAAAGGYIHRRHLGAISEVADDPVDVALGFVGTPYVWGGRTRDGIDCSGLTQAALIACGIACPRDSDQQRAAVGHEVPSGERRRGDLACFPGHVGLLVDADTLIHANAYWMSTTVEPLADVTARVAVTGFRRPETDVRP